jgi:hypothetical protein
MMLHAAVRYDPETRRDGAHNPNWATCLSSYWCNLAASGEDVTLVTMTSEAIPGSIRLKRAKVARISNQ